MNYQLKVADKFQKMDKELNIQKHIIRAIQQLSIVQQAKLLDFINAMLGKAPKPSNKAAILGFAGSFDKQSIQEMNEALEDCEQIDENEW